MGGLVEYRLYGVGRWTRDRSKRWWREWYTDEGEGGRRCEILSLENVYKGYTMMHWRQHKKESNHIQMWFQKLLLSSSLGKRRSWLQRARLTGGQLPFIGIPMRGMGWRSPLYLLQLSYVTNVYSIKSCSDRSETWQACGGAQNHLSDSIQVDPIRPVLFKYSVLFSDWTHYRPEDGEIASPGLLGILMRRYPRRVTR